MGVHDVIVAGVGGMGSATCWQLARRGVRVLGLERFDIPHTMGSSHGFNRIIRLAYFEDPAYVPLLRRAYALWREAETAYGEQLLFVTGSLEAGPPDSLLIEGIAAACRAHDLPHETLDAAEVARRHPAWRLRPDQIAVFQPDGGFVASERSITAHVELAIAAGAEIRAREPILDWEPTAGGGVRVRTARTTYEAGALVLSTGAWIGDHVPGLRPHAVPERQVLGWFSTARPDLFKPAAFPVGIIADGRAGPYWFFFPTWGAPGFKFGLHRHLGETGHADALSREPTARDEAALREGVARYFPLADGPALALRACLYTNTADEHFVVDHLPGLPQVVVASPCSGHGFKFASVMGEILADLATGRTPPFDLSLFRLARLGAG